MTLEERLAELRIDLPPALAPGGLYAPVVVHRGTAWVSGQLPRHGDELLFPPGRIGAELTPEQGREAARAALLLALAALRDELGGLRRVRQVLQLNVHVRADEAFTSLSAVADGASSLIRDLFGPVGGHHARTTTGAAMLPRGACLELDAVFAVDD
ncbi:MAG: RidA family protein [Burkholderiaceae bacterium]